MGAYASTEAEDGEAQYHGQGMTHDPRAPRVDPETSARHNANRVHEAVYIPDLDVFGAFMDFAPYFPGQIPRQASGPTASLLTKQEERAYHETMRRMKQHNASSPSQRQLAAAAARSTKILRGKLSPARGASNMQHDAVNNRFNSGGVDATPLSSRGLVRPSDTVSRRQSISSSSSSSSSVTSTLSLSSNGMDVIHHSPTPRSQGRTAALQNELIRQSKLHSTRGVNLFSVASGVAAGGGRGMKTSSTSSSTSGIANAHAKGVDVHGSPSDPSVRRFQQSCDDEEVSHGDSEVGTVTSVLAHVRQDKRQQQQQQQHTRREAHQTSSPFKASPVAKPSLSTLARRNASSSPVVVLSTTTSPDLDAEMDIQWSEFQSADPCTTPPKSYSIPSALSPAAKKNALVITAKSPFAASSSVQASCHCQHATHGTCGESASSIMPLQNHSDASTIGPTALKADTMHHNTHANKEQCQHHPQDQQPQQQQQQQPLRPPLPFLANITSRNNLLAQKTSLTLPSSSPSHAEEPTVVSRPPLPFLNAIRKSPASSSLPPPPPLPSTSTLSSSTLVKSSLPPPPGMVAAGASTAASSSSFQLSQSSLPPPPLPPSSKSMPMSSLLPPPPLLSSSQDSAPRPPLPFLASIGGGKGSLLPPPPPPGTAAVLPSSAAPAPAAAPPARRNPGVRKFFWSRLDAPSLSAVGGLENTVWQDVAAKIEKPKQRTKSSSRPVGSAEVLAASASKGVDEADDIGSESDNGNVSEDRVEIDSEELMKTFTAVTKPRASATAAVVPAVRLLRVLLADKSRQVEIALSSSKHTVHSLTEAIQEAKFEVLSVPLLRILSKFIPTQEEQTQIEAFAKEAAESIGSASPCKLGLCEELYHSLLSNVTHLQTRLTLLADLQSECIDANMQVVAEKIKSLWMASTNLRTSQHLRTILGVVLRFGNLLNSDQPAAKGFHVSSLAKLGNTRSAGANASEVPSLLHYLVTFLHQNKPECIEYVRSTTPLFKQAASAGDFDWLCKEIVTAERTLVQLKTHLKAIISGGSASSESIYVSRMLERGTAAMRRYIATCKALVGTLCIVLPSVSFFGVCPDLYADKNAVKTSLDKCLTAEKALVGENKEQISCRMNSSNDESEQKNEASMLDDADIELLLQQAMTILQTTNHTAETKSLEEIANISDLRLSLQSLDIIPSISQCFRKNTSTTSATSTMGEFFGVFAIFGEQFEKAEKELAYKREQKQQAEARKARSKLMAELKNVGGAPKKSGASPFMATGHQSGSGKTALTPPKASARATAHAPSPVAAAVKISRQSPMSAAKTSSARAFSDRNGVDSTISSLRATPAKPSIHHPVNATAKTPVKPPAAKTPLKTPTKSIAATFMKTPLRTPISKAIEEMVTSTMAKRVRTPLAPLTMSSNMALRSPSQTPKQPTITTTAIATLPSSAASVMSHRTPNNVRVMPRDLGRSSGRTKQQHENTQQQQSMLGATTPLCVPAAVAPRAVDEGEEASPSFAQQLHEAHEERHHDAEAEQEETHQQHNRQGTEPVSQVAEADQEEFEYEPEGSIFGGFSWW